MPGGQPAGRTRLDAFSYNPYRSCMRLPRLVVVLTLLAWWPKFGFAQNDPPVRLADGAVLLAGGVLFATPHVLGINHHPPACAPCDPASVPWFDRWAIAVPRRGWDYASTMSVAGVGVFAGWDLLETAPDPATAHVSVLAQSAVLALGMVEITKALATRNRPVLYTSEAPGAARSLDNQRSWPSGHTATAVALVTSYFLSVGQSDAGPASWQRPVLLLAGAGVGAMRVAAAKHFPSDVVSGAAFGVVSALVVHQLRF